MLINVKLNIFSNLKASVTEKIYPAMGHTINEDEITIVKNIVSNSFVK